MHLILIETSGNQNYIFTTNKLRENVGASELTYRVGTQWVLEAMEDAGGPSGLWPEDGDASQLRRNLLDARHNRPITEDGVVVEVIVATSGKALLLVKDPKVGPRIVQNVTMKALECAPGIDVCGVIEEFDWARKPLGEVNEAIHKKFEQIHSSYPGPAARFLRLPVVEDCRSSGLPAERWHDVDKNDEAAKSAVSIRKWESRDDYARRMQKLPGLEERKVNFADNVGELEGELKKDSQWLAVVHADGNGLGEIFLKFGQYAKCQPDPPAADYTELNRQYVDKFRRFSLALDVCAEQAFLTALDGLLKRNADAWYKPLILPLVLGGDDLTVVCDGKVALQFTRDFLKGFERETEENHFAGIIPEIAQEALGAPRLSACAGVAIIKPHFPFSAAYDLAEELIMSAKQVKKLVTNPDKKIDELPAPWPCSAIDFHALYDSTVSELDELRSRKVDGQMRGKLLTDSGQTRLYSRPYVVSAKLDGAEGKEWAGHHSWEKLEARVQVILRRDKDERRALPNSQLHDLRAGLFLGKDAANARYQLIRHRYAEVDLKVFEEADGTLFFQDCDSKGKENSFAATKLLDAMEAANFWVREETNDGGSGK